VTRAVLDRISRFDGRLKSYAMLTSDLALTQAGQADREIAHGAIRGPLHGVPIAVKDLCHTKGIPTAAGMAIHKDYRPEQDATVVTRLHEAGAVLLGKLQLTEGAFAQHHPLIDPPVNPWSAAHWTGVSSSGSEGFDMGLIWTARLIWIRPRSGLCNLRTGRRSPRD
jgi:amidase